MEKEITADMYALAVPAAKIPHILMMGYAKQTKGSPDRSAPQCVVAALSAYRGSASAAG